MLGIAKMFSRKSNEDFNTLFDIIKRPLDFLRNSIFGRYSIPSNSGYYLRGENYERAL